MSSEIQSGKIEILLFSLGSSEIFGINVFKIREVTEMISVTGMPGASGAMMGMISLRGNVIPVVDLATGINMTSENHNPRKLIIAEFASRSVAFAVDNVDKIVRLDWSEVKPPQSYDSSDSFILGLILLENKQLVSLLDIESVCQNILPIEETEPVTTFDVRNSPPVFFVDDSRVARKQITHVLDAMGLQHMHAVNGDDAQEKLNKLAGTSDQTAASRVSLVLVDEEMPGMDGCTLTRTLKADPRFKNIPVLMYSSLTSDENERRGLAAGVNIYVKKFDSEKLSRAIGSLLEHAPEPG